jgi:hypothetical protein
MWGTGHCDLHLSSHGPNTVHAEPSSPRERPAVSTATVPFLTGINAVSRTKLPFILDRAFVLVVGAKHRLVNLIRGCARASLSVVSFQEKSNP